MQESSTPQPLSDPQAEPPTASEPPKLPGQVGDSLVFKDDGRRVELIALARGVGDLPAICAARGFKYLDATRYDHGAGSAAKGRMQLPIYVAVKPTDQVDAIVTHDGPPGLERVEVDAWYWRVKASRPKETGASV